MKKIKFYAYAGAIALLSTVGFTACSSEDDVAEVNPTYDGTNVRTDFAFSIAGGPMSGTRMTGDNTLQATGAFKGMKNMYLLPFGLGSGNKPANGSETNIGKSYPLGTLGNTEISTSQSSKVYSLQIPIGTDNFLFYGTVANSTVTELTQRGALTSSLTENTKNTNDISFSLVNIHGDLNTDLNNTTTSVATNLAKYLSDIAKVSITDVTDASKTIYWYETPDKAAIDGKYSTLATLYNNFTLINDARAGSAEAVLRTVLDLYVTCKAVVQAGNESTGNVYALAGAICSAITNTSSTYYAIITDSDADPKNWTATWGGLTATTFPHNLKLPMGAAQLEYNGTSHAFSYKTSPNYVTDPTVQGVALTKICYPAELIYFDNSPLRATDSYKTAGDYPVTVGNWDAALGTAGGFTSDWSGTRVEPSTRAVAMQNNVNYGVALLETTVKMATGAAAMEDNMKGIHTSATDNQKNIDGTKFTLTGILIGGQPAIVGWDMTNPGLPTVSGNGKGDFVNVIYDQDIPFSTAIPSDGSTTSPSIYTLVLDNYTGNTSEPAVRFALELVNGSGKDFYGKDGLIPAGHTFYLCGAMTPSGTWTPATRNTSYRVTHEDVGRVFIQDYKTTANITISNDALQKAYSTIPDLRSTDVLFGLSVDLKWETGLNFNVEL